MEIDRILLAVDGSEHAQRATAWAADLARCREVPLTVLHVMTKLGSGRVPAGLEEYERIEHVHLTERDVLRSAAKRIVDDAAVAARRAGAPDVAIQVRSGDPGTVIAEVADELGADLIVMGSRGLSDVGGLFLGSVSHKVVHGAHRAVLTVR